MHYADLWQSVVKFGEIRSNNGTNFVGGERELRDAISGWNQSKKLIRSVQKVLNSIFKVQTLDEEGLHTVLCEAEAIINGRLITKASTDPNDLEALTPNHLLLLKTSSSLPPGEF